MNLVDDHNRRDLKKINKVQTHKFFHFLNFTNFLEIPS